MVVLLWCEIGNPFFLEGITKEKFHRMFGLVPCAAGSDRALVLDCRVGLRRRYFGGKGGRSSVLDAYWLRREWRDLGPLSLVDCGRDYRVRPGNITRLLG